MRCRCSAEALRPFTERTHHFETLEWNLRAGAPFRTGARPHLEAHDALYHLTIVSSESSAFPQISAHQVQGVTYALAIAWRSFTLSMYPLKCEYGFISTLSGKNIVMYER